jgi:hypothetical protein
VEGGSNPRSAEFYHPFVITDEPMGGYDRLSEKQKDEVRVLAGVEFTRSVSATRCDWKSELRIRIRMDPDPHGSGSRFENCNLNNNRRTRPVSWPVSSSPGQFPPRDVTGNQGG